MKDGTALIAPFGGISAFFYWRCKVIVCGGTEIKKFNRRIQCKALLTAPTLKNKIALYEMLKEVKSDLSVFSYEYNAKPLIKKILERGIYYDKY